MIPRISVACRSTMKAPGFAIAAIFVLALGIGGKKHRGVSGLVNTMCLRRPVRREHRASSKLFSQDKKESQKKFSRLLLSNLNRHSRAGIPVFSGVRGATKRSGLVG